MNQDRFAAGFKIQDDFLDDFSLKSIFVELKA